MSIRILSTGISLRSLCLTRRCLVTLALTMLLLTAAASSAQAGTLAGWEMNSLPGGTNNFGPSPYPPTTTDPNLTVGGWTRGSGVGTTGSGAARAWGANNWCAGSTCNVATESAAIAANNFVTFTATAKVGYQASFSSISKFNYRRSATGPGSGELQYQVGSGSFTDVAALSYSSTAATGAAITPLPIDLSGISALQNVPTGTTVTFRIVNWDATSTSGTWYVFDVGPSPTVNDFEVQGTVTTAGPTATQIGVETAADGSGSLVPAQTIVTGNSITVYAVSRDASNAFVANAAATWSLTSVTGSVVAGDLVASGDGKSAVFTANGAGSAVIHVASGSLTSDDSGIITIQGLPTSPTATGQVSSPTVAYDQTVTLEVGVSPGANPTSSGVVVTGDLSSIGGGSNVTFQDNQNYTYSSQVLITSSVPGGAKTIPISVQDGQGRTASTSVTFKVVGSFTVIHMNDTHARVTPHKWIVPTDNLVSPGFQDVGGAASMSTAILQLATTYSNSLVIDGGDVSEGNPIGDFSSIGDASDNYTMTQFYNLLSTKLTGVPGRNGRGIDAVVVGNHDVRNADYITHLMELSTSGVPVISVNVRDIATHTAYFAPYTTVTINGTKIGILGYTTQDAEVGAELASTLEVVTCDWNGNAAIHLKDWVIELRNNQGCDLVILAAHVGHTEIAINQGSGSTETFALLADDGSAKLPEIAVTGHWHTWASTVWQPASLNYKTIFTESGSFMHYVGELQVDGTGKYVSSAQHALLNSQYTADPDVQSLIDNFTAAYNTAHPGMPVGTILGYTADNLMLDNQMKWWSADEYPWSGNNTAGQFICDAMQWKAAQLFGQCDLSLESGGGVRADIPAGPVTYLQVYETFPWSDDLFYRVNMTGQEIVNFVTTTGCDTGFSKALHVVAHDGIPTAVTFNGAPIDLQHTYTVAINSFMYQHPPSGWTWTDTNPVTSPVLCRDGIMDYMKQFPQSAPYAVGGPRYELDTEFSGQYRGVVTMMNDNDSSPNYEYAFIRFLTAAPETLQRRGSAQVPTALVNADGTIDPTHPLAEQEIYRSYLGFKQGALQPGDIIETRGKGSFYDGNPEFVDQEGIYADKQEFNIVGHDASLAKPVYMVSIQSFWTDNYKNHYVEFLAKKASANTVTDQYDSTIEVWDATAFVARTLPGNVGDLLILSGITTMESYALRFRCATVDLAANRGITNFPALVDVTSQVAAIQVDNPGSSVTLTAGAGPSPTLRYLAPVADAQVASGHASTNYGASKNLYVQSSSSLYGNERDWLRFDLSGLPSGSTITGAALQMYCWSATGPALAAEVHGGTDDSWVEGTVNYSNEPAFGSVLDTQTLAAEATNVWYSWDVGSFVQSKWAGSKLVSLLVKPVTEGSSASPAPSYGFDAKEYGSSVPVLAVTLASNAPTVAQTQFFYRYSTDNTNWTAWTSAGLGTGSTNALNFTYPQGNGYYEFYSQATDGTGTVEAVPAPPIAEASVHHGAAPEYTTAAIVSLSNLAQAYDGTRKNAGVVTVPPGLANVVTYNGSSSVPVSPGSYAVAVTVTQPGFTGSASGTLVVSQGSQTISFAPLAPVVVGAPSFNLTATASSGLSVQFQSGNTSVATVSGTTVTVVGAGTATITATQPGDGTNWLPAISVSRGLVVNAATGPAAVPAAPTWALLGMVILLFAAGARRISRRRSL
jgi:2',3'-cyclic-nucleotide 2'-phosphodiesterase (5'-nucleotidase family)